MAVQIRVLKGGKPVSGVTFYYRKPGLLGGTGKKTTDDQGYVDFRIDSGNTAVIQINGKGISYETNGYYLKSGLNEFKFWVLFLPILHKKQMQIASVLIC